MLVKHSCRDGSACFFTGRIKNTLPPFDGLGVQIVGDLRAVREIAQSRRGDGGEAVMDGCLSLGCFVLSLPIRTRPCHLWLDCVPLASRWVHAYLV